MVTTDPLRMLYHHSFGNYYDDQPFELNRGFVATEILLARYRSEAYDSFILGSSRSFAYRCEDWSRYIPSAKCFHYSAASENLRGISHKVALLDSLDVPLRNLLIVVDVGSG